jgi:aminoglycoside phosphotransferase (APT) family kinase protein
MDDQLTAGLLTVAETVLPGADLSAAGFARGGSHDGRPGQQDDVVRIARTVSATALLPRRTRLLHELANLGLPFAVPVPLTDVMTVGDRIAVALSWLDGQPSPKYEGGDPKQLAALLEALRAVDATPFADLLARPHEYAGGDRWVEVMLDQAVQAVLDLPPVEYSFVHGDLAGGNMHWNNDGRLLGVLDWDLAQLYDPAVDAAALAWHGWDKVAAAVDADTFHRARVHYLTAGIQQIAFAILNNQPERVIQERTAAMTAWIAGTSAPLG